jgi:hypothetical protein
MGPARALSIRQPYAELILRGLKTVEYRSRPTRIIGERFFIYASKGKGQWADFAAESIPEDLPRGVIVGEARISHVTPPTEDMPYWHWHLTDVARLDRPRKLGRHPQPVWFRPF